VAIDKMNDALKKKLLAAAGSGAIGIAMAIGAWYEGDGPTVRQADGSVLYRVYIDPVGIPTVCRGVTGADVIKGKLYTRSECEVLERKHYAVAEVAARRLFPAYGTYNPWIQAALLDWLYNTGDNPATHNSTLRAKFNRGDLDGGCAELAKWVKGRVAGQLVTLNGLVARRDTTQEVCLHWGRS
jgi:lysozyme